MSGHCWQVHVKMVVNFIVLSYTLYHNTYSRLRLYNKLYALPFLFLYCFLIVMIVSVFLQLTLNQV